MSKKEQWYCYNGKVRAIKDGKYITLTHLEKILKENNLTPVEFFEKYKNKELHLDDVLKIVYSDSYQKEIDALEFKEEIRDYIIDKLLPMITDYKTTIISTHVKKDKKFKVSNHYFGLEFIVKE